MSFQMLKFDFEDEKYNSPVPSKSPSVDDPCTDPFTDPSTDPSTEDSDLLVSEEIDPQGYHVPRDIERRRWMQIRRGDDPLLHLLHSYDVSDHVLARCLELNIGSDMLATLNDQDLQNLGVLNPATRQLMLEEFRLLPNQELCFNTGDDAIAYQKAHASPLLLNTIFTNLLNLKYALSSVVLQMYERPVERVEINGRDYGSRELLKILDALSHEVFELELRMSRLQHGANFLRHMATAAIADRVTDRKNDSDSAKKPRRRMYGNWLALLGTVSMFGYCAWRCWRKTAIPAPSLTSYYQPNYLRYHY